MVVPRRVGDELRRRRMALRLKQQDIADRIGTTRAYVSAVERGVDWDPDAEKLVVWARALDWDDDYILGRLNRHGVPGEITTRLPPDVVAAISEAVAAGIRDGWEEVMRALRDGTPMPTVEDDDPSAREKLA